MLQKTLRWPVLFLATACVSAPEPSRLRHPSFRSRLRARRCRPRCCSTVPGSTRTESRGRYPLFREPRFRSLVVSEVRKSLSLRAVWREAQLLIPELRPSDLVRSFAGNRAQVVSRDGQLVDDIVVRDTARTVHVLNAVSPGLTCSLPFGEHLARVCHAKLQSVT